MSKGGSGKLAVIASSVIYAALYSTAYIAVKFGVRYAPPLSILVVRFLIASLCLAAFVRWLGHAWPASPKAWIRLSILGLLNLGLPAALNFVALKHASAGMASMMLAANPLILALLAPKLLGEKLTPMKIAGLLLGFGGVAFVMIARLLAAGPPGKAESPIGLLLLGLAVLCMVGGTIVFKRFPPREPLLMVNVVQQLASAILLLPVALVLEHPSKTVMTFTLVAATLHLVFIVSIAAGLLWFWLLGRGEASVASSALFLVPILGLLYAALLLGEAFTLRDGFGLIGVTLGLVLIRRNPAPKPAPAAPVGSIAPSKAS